VPTWTNRRVLITQNSLFSIAGSEVVAYELAEFFSGRGAVVTVATCGFSPMWEKQFSLLANTTLLRLDDPRLDDGMKTDPPDIAWIQHQIIPIQLLRNPGSTAFLFHHMSAFLPQEFPLAHRVEAALASAVLFPAEETLKAQRASRLLEDVNSNRLFVFGNPAPDRFWMASPLARTHLARVLLVSNHIPDELATALSSLPSDCEVVIRGEETSLGGVSQLVQPDELAKADAIISIGKTVQYALAAGVPVYCYDRFGGPGWLTPENVGLARHNNFSGRGFTTRSAEVLADELVSGFETAAVHAGELHNTIARDFLLSVAIERVMDSLTPHVIRQISEPDLMEFTLGQEVTNGLANAVAARNMTITAHEMTIDHMRTMLSLSEAKSDQLAIEVLHHQEVFSRSEPKRISRAMTFVRARLVAIRKLFTRTKRSID